MNSIDVEGLRVQIDGQGPTLVMLHGWPDSPALWDSAVAAWSDRWRCVRFPLPGYDRAQGPRPVSVAEMTRLIAAVVDTVSPDAPVTLVLHDWGCLFGYEYAARHPRRVSRIVGVDIGDAGSRAHVAGLTAVQKLQIAGYQLWLAVAWRLGGRWPRLADRMTRWMARQVGCRNAPDAIGWPMNYPYAMGWFGDFGGLRGLARPEATLGITWPLLYVHGRRKPFAFHSAAWLDALAARPGCAVHGLDTGHWVMRQQPAAFNALVRDWLIERESERDAPGA